MWPRHKMYSGGLGVEARSSKVVSLGSRVQGLMYYAYPISTMKWNRLAELEACITCLTVEGVPQNYTEAAKWFRLAAEQADFALAQSKPWPMMYYQWQRCTARLCKEAAKWLSLGGRTGYVLRHSINLGFMYYHGEGVPQDYTEAGEVVSPGSRTGTKRKAQRACLVMYYQGQGIPQDYIEAHKWFNLAASQLLGEEYDAAVDAREETAKKMTPDQIAEAQRLAREWMQHMVCRVTGGT